MGGTPTSVSDDDHREHEEKNINKKDGSRSKNWQIINSRERVLPFVFGSGLQLLLFLLFSGEFETRVHTILRSRRHSARRHSLKIYKLN